MSAVAAAEGPHAHGHPDFVAHHFESAEQQFDANKLGTWLFLATEVLFFSGLFVAYGVYRVNHPEVFLDAHHHLSVALGAFNTVVLLASSLAIAWSVRCAQRGDNRGLMGMLLFTLACAAFFLGVKTVEYWHKFDEGLYWAAWYNPLPPEQMGHTNFTAIACVGALVGGLALVAARAFRGTSPARSSLLRALGWMGLGYAAAIPLALLITPVSHAAAGHGEAAHANDAHAAEPVAAADAAPAEPPYNIATQGNFFSIYYAMTGVHVIHILAGIGVICWLVARTARGDFSPEHYDAVECVGLYWHLVDLVWIYLFPLLYLIR